jgi:hypothetical protein
VGRSLGLLIAIGVVIRLLIMPIGFGQDFVVWNLASAATLHGVNIYAHHPPYPGGPYAYFPLFLYIELPMRWLALHAGLSFLVLGKLPILAGDVATTALIAGELRHRGVSERVCTLAAALFFLNPLVLYNGVYYGRFDSIALALLLAALRATRLRQRGAAVWWGAAVAAKTFPVFTLAGFLYSQRGRWWQPVLALPCILGALSIPYLGSWRAMVHDIVTWDISKTPQGLSWQTLLSGSVDAHRLQFIGYVLLGSFALTTLGLVVIRDLPSYCLAVLLVFVLCSKVVLEQYLVWLLPLLIIVSTRPALRVTALAVSGIVTTIGMLANPDIHPWGRSPAAVVIALAACMVTAVLVLVRAQFAARPEPHEAAPGPGELTDRERDILGLVEPGPERRSRRKRTAERAPESGRAGSRPASLRRG